MERGDPISLAAPADLARWLVQASPDGLWVFDGAGRTVFANDRMAAILGREPAEMVDFNALSALDEVGQVQLLAHLRELERVGEPGDNLECSLVRKDGTRLEALVSHTPIVDDDGRRRGWLHRVSEYTQQRQLLDIIQRREHQLAEAQAIAKVGSWEWDVAADQVTWSDELFRIYEIDPQHFVPTYAGFIDGIHPEDRERVSAAVTGVFEGGEDFEFEARIVRRSGNVGWIRGRGLVVRDESGAPVRMSGTAQDITESKDAEHALALLQAVATAANNADTLAEGVPVAVREVSRYTAWQAQAAYVVGPDQRLLELSLGEGAAGPSISMSEARQLAARAAADGALIMLDHGGGVLLAAPLVAEERVMGVMVLWRQGAVRPEDWETATVTQAMALFARVAERESASEKLAAARDEAMSASRAKSEFLATMSHEIRTPLNGVIGLSELLTRTDLDDNQRRLADGIEQAGRALLSLVNDVLDLSKIEAGHLDLEEVDFDPRAVVEQSASLVAGAARAKALEYVIACQPDLPELVRGDPVRLGQVVANLTSNAVKFTSAGEVVVRARLDDDEGAAGASPRLRIEVSDTGLGIAEHDQRRLFDAFSQADSSTTRQFGGTGLGLAISRRIVAAMGGQIGVTSAPGVGSTFWFTARLGVSGSPPPRRTDDLRRSVADTRVLVVDDNATNRMIMMEQLADWGAEGRDAESVQEGLELLEEAHRQGRRFDVVLLDYLMPGADGLEFAQRARRDERNSATRLLLLTSATEPDRALLDSSGVDLVLSKPVLSARLLEALAALVGHQSEAGNTTRAEDNRPDGVLGRGRVLLVEDNRVNQMVAEGILTSLGYAVSLAENGQEAVTRFAEAPDQFDAVLMDCQMPVMDGYDATRTIRAMEQSSRRVPIIALTAAAVAGERERCLAAGMDDFLTKPVDVALLRSAMHRWVPSAVIPNGSAADAPLAEPPVEVPPAAPAVDPEVLDAARLDELLDLDPGDPTMLLRFIGRFGDTARRTLAEMRDARRDGTAHELGRLAHALKGSAANLGAHHLAAVCKDVEWLGEDGVAADEVALDRVAREVDRAASALEEFAAALSRPGDP